jgi:hypothetical protein
MALPVSFLGASCQMGLGSAVTLNSGKHYLVIAWEDVRAGLGASSTSPATTSLEDYLAALTFRLIDLVVADTNPTTGAKLTAARQFTVQESGIAIDQGVFNSGVNSTVYSGVIGFYTVDTNPVRPTETAL